VSDPRPIGVFDSGVGGLTVLKELVAALPGEAFVYLGDTGRVPYGPKPLPMVREYAFQDAAFLVARGAKAVVVACNTASAAALPGLEQRVPVPVWGVVEPGVEAALASAIGGRIGVIGTTGTIASRSYQHRLEARGASVWARACPLFVPIAEEGAADGEIARLVARRYLSDAPPLDALVLACTHYPILKATIAGVLPGVALIDSARAVAAVVARELSGRGLAAPAAAPAVSHFVTGDVGGYVHIARIIGGPPGPVRRIAIRDLEDAARALSGTGPREEAAPEEGYV
jgi:glutamate racemase